MLSKQSAFIYTSRDFSDILWILPIFFYDAVSVTLEAKIEFFNINGFFIKILQTDVNPFLKIAYQVLVKDLLRKYPQWSHDCIAVVGNISSKNV